MCKQGIIAHIFRVFLDEPLQFGDEFLAVALPLVNAEALLSDEIVLPNLLFQHIHFGQSLVELLRKQVSLNEFAEHFHIVGIFFRQGFVQVDEVAELPQFAVKHAQTHLVPLVFGVEFGGLFNHPESVIKSPDGIILFAQLEHRGSIVGHIAQGLLEVADGAFGVLAVLALQAVGEIGGVLFLVGFACKFRFHRLGKTPHRATQKQ